MFKTLRTKLLLGLTPLLAIMVGLGVWAIVMFSRLGNNIDVILRENYRSVLAAEGMKEALERMDSSLLFAIGGEEQQARAQFAENAPIFAKHLKTELHNITLPGEQAMADRLATLHEQYLALSDRFYALGSGNKEDRTRLYFSQLLPTFQSIKREADNVLNLNQKNMEDESARARKAAAVSIQVMALVILGAAVMASAIALLMSRSLLTPIRAVTAAARGMAKGNLDQVVPILTRDELGELALSFNRLARTIREFRQAGTERLLREQKTAQATIDSFPDPVVVLDPSGSVERANPAARRILGAVPTNGAAPWVPPSALQAPIEDVLKSRTNYLPTSLDNAICLRDDGQERFFLPRALSIRDDQTGMLGAALVLSDVTKFRLVDQLKSNMVSTVSHELKTPLTSVQMAIHLLLEEIVGPLTPKQVELLLAARQDSERLLAMVNDLLDLTRIEQGGLKLVLKYVAVSEVVAEAVDRFHGPAQDAGVVLETQLPANMPPVLVDRERVGHIFDNLLSNALRHTERGGKVRVTARPEDKMIRLAVEDTGEGIPPEHLSHIFEKFFRVPGARHRGGAGLGLAIVREIVGAHGGVIEVQSRPGVGTTFTLTLPIGPLEDRPTDAERRVP